MRNITKLNAREIVRLNATAWDTLPIKRMQLDVNLVRCQKYLFPQGRGKRLLYIGFGEGQNLLYFAKEGFLCFGTEISSARLKSAQALFARAKKKADVRLVSDNRLPFPDNYFDVVVAWQSLYYNNEETLAEALSEIYRVLKPRGKFLSSMLSPEQKLLTAKRVTGSVYRPSKQTGQHRGVVYAFKNQTQIRKKYRLFKNLQIGYYSSFLFRSKNFHYVIYGEKPQSSR